MIDITNKSKCCGCTACVQSCPVHCISLLEDNEGFVYPKVDKDLCINCNRCERTCPILNPERQQIPQCVYAAKNKNEEQRKLSSSGGVFIPLAERIIENHGVVFGARFDDNWEVEHSYAETKEELKTLMRSKYVQSRIGNSYLKVEEFLKKGRDVLFVGTSCQIAGLKKFLGKDYDNLLSVDFICHGVPSLAVWRKHLYEIKVKNIVSINFREKTNDDFSWRKFGLQIIGSSGQLYSKSLEQDTYLRGFLADLYLRPSCYDCPAKGGKSHSDITMADYWGVHTTFPEWNDNRGVSLAIVNSDKGENIFKNISSRLYYKEITVQDIHTANESYFKSPKRPHASERFWKQFPIMSLKENVDSCLYIPLWRQHLKSICTYSDIAIKKIIGKI